MATNSASSPPGDRDVLLLFAWEQLSYQDIALALGIPVGTVRSRLNRARRKLSSAGAATLTFLPKEAGHGFAGTLA